MRFTITEMHLKLLKHTYWTWENCEYGAAAIDCKRPFGNSDVVDDVRDIFSNPGLDEDQIEQLCRDLVHVLQIACVTGEFKTGEYYREDVYSARSWKKYEPSPF